MAGTLALAAGFAAPAHAQDLVVSYASDGGAAAVRAAGGEVTGAVDGTRFRTVDAEGTSVAGLRRRLEADERIAVVEPNHVRHLFALPNDPWIAKGQQGWLDTVRLPEAWDLAKATPAQRLAVIDDGVDDRNPDLPHVLPDIDLRAEREREDPAAEHGTWVAGIAAAETGNDLGIAGAAWSATILPVRVATAVGAATDAAIAEGIDRAVDAGAQVINLSLGGPQPATVLREAVARAQARDVVVVAAAGNESTDEPQYPAALPGVLAVGATDWAGDVAGFSSYGDWVDLVAPGVDMASLADTMTDHIAPGDLFKAGGGGTSYAAPVVSGAALLVRAQHPEWSQAQVVQRLRATARDTGLPGPDRYSGQGVLDVAAALGAAPRPRPLAVPDDPAPTRIALGTERTGRLETADDADTFVVDVPARGHLEVQAGAPGGDVPVDVAVLTPTGQVLGEDEDYVTVPAGAGGDRLVRVSTSGPAATAYTLRVTAAGSEPGRWGVTTSYDRADLDHAALAVGDVSGDGRADVVASGGGGGPTTLGLLRQDEEGLLEPAGATDLPRPPQSLAIADFDGDGHGDVAVADEAGVRIAAGTGRGFAPLGAPLPGPGSFRMLVAAAKVDGDNRPDLLVRTNDGVALLRNGTGGWTRTVLASGPFGDVAAGDLNGDGRTDIAAARLSSAGGIVLLRQTAAGGWATDERDLFAGGLAIADVSGDGFADLVASHFEQPRVTVFAQDAGHGLAGGADWTTPRLARRIAVADVDRDGRADVLGLGPIGGGGLLLGRPGGSFVAEDHGEGVADELADVTGDGGPDLVTGLGAKFVTVSGQATATWPRPEWVRGVTGGARPQVAFGRALDPASVTARSVRLTTAAGEPVAAAVTYDATARTATLTPASPLGAGAYDVTVDGVRDTLGARTTEPLRTRIRVGGAPADTTPPQTTISAAGDEYHGVRYRFWADETVRGYECSLDGGAFAPCRSPQFFAVDAERDYTVRVRAIDAAGNVDPTPAARVVHKAEWSHTEYPPAQLAGTSGTRQVDTRFDGADAATLAWTAPSDGTLTVDTEGTGFDTVLRAGPVDAVRLADDDGGPGLTSRLTFAVRAGREYRIVVGGWFDGLGSAGGTATLRWAFAATRDTTPPDTRILSDFRITSEPLATFECAFDGGAFAPCDARPQVPGGPAGQRTMAARAIDAAGNADPTPATFTWVQDAEQVQTYLGAEDSATGEVVLSLMASAGGVTPGAATFACRVDGGAWTPCADRTTWPRLPDGIHHFAARATAGGVTDPSPATATVIVDTVAPDTVMVSGPVSSPDRDAALVFTSEPGADLECRLDAEPWRPCRERAVFTGLPDGTHVFAVRAIDGLGTVDPTPATWTWTIGGGTGDPSGPADPGDPGDPGGPGDAGGENPGSQDPGTGGSAAAATPGAVAGDAPSLAPPSPLATAPMPRSADARAPRLTALRASAPRDGRLPLSFRLDERARLAIRVVQLRGGRERTLPGTVTAQGRAGANRLRVRARLPRGRFRVVVVATDAAGNRRTIRSAVVRVG